MFTVRFSNGRSAFYDTEVKVLNSIDEVLAAMVRHDGPDWNIYAVGNRTMIGETDEASVVVSAESDAAMRDLGTIFDCNGVVTNADDYYADDDFNEDDFILVTGSRLGLIKA